RLEQRQETRIFLDRRHMSAGFQERARQPAGAWANLNDGFARDIARRACDAARDVEIQQEVLTETLVCPEAVRFQFVAQRRQFVGVHGRARCSAIAHASLSAARKLSSRARPEPAMSKPVPWSGEVRMIGRPSVTFTASQKCSVLIGMRPWSW